MQPSHQVNPHVPDAGRNVAGKTSKPVQSDPNLTPLGTRPGLKQNMIYAFREFQSSVFHLFKSDRSEPVATGKPAVEIAAAKIGVVLNPDEQGQSVAGFMVGNRFVSLAESVTLAKENSATGKQIGHLLRALSTGHRQKTKNSQEKIGSKLYVEESVLRRQTGVLFKEHRVAGNVISVDLVRRTGQKLLAQAESSGSPADAAKWTQFKANIRAIGESLPAFKAVLADFELGSSAASEAPAHIDEPLPIADTSSESRIALFNQIKAQLDAISVPSINSTTIDSLKASFSEIQSSQTQLVSINLNPEGDIRLTDQHVQTLSQLAQTKTNQLAQNRSEIPAQLTQKILEDLPNLNFRSLTDAIAGFSKDSAELIRYDLDDFQLGQIDFAQTALCDFGKTLGRYDELTPENRASVYRAYRDGALFVNDPESHLLVARTAQLLRDAESDPGYTNARIKEIFTGDVSTLFLIQDHVATPTIEAVTESTHLDGIISNLIQKCCPPETLEKSKIQHALRISARYLCHELAPVLGLTKLSSFAFDPVTIKALTSHPKIKIQSFNIILGQVMILQHQLTPFPNLETALKDAGIMIPEAQIRAYFAQGVKSSAKIDSILNTLTAFSRSMAKNETLKSLMASVLEDRAEVWYDRYFQQVVARQLGLSGTSRDQINANKTLLGDQLDLTAAKRKRSKVGNVVIPGKVKDFGAGLFKKSADLSTIVQQLNEKSDALVAARGQLDAIQAADQGQFNTAEIATEIQTQLNSLTGQLTTAKAQSNSGDRQKSLEKLQVLLKEAVAQRQFDSVREKVAKYVKEGVFKYCPDFPEKFATFYRFCESNMQGPVATKSEVAARKTEVAELEAKIVKLEGQIDTIFKGAGKTFQPIVEVIRLGIMKAFAEVQTQPGGLLLIRSGQKNDQIEAFLSEFGITSETFKAQGISATHPMRALIARECRQFTGPEDFVQWVGKATVESGDKQNMRARAQKEEHPEIQLVLGTQSRAHQLAQDRVTQLKPGEKFCFNWGKERFVDVPEAAKTVEATFLAGVGVGVGVGIHNEKQFWVEKTETEAGTGFNVVFGHEFGAKIGLSMDFFGGVIKTELGAARDRRSGFRLRFDSTSAVSHFIASVMSENVDAAVLGQASMIFDESGHVQELSAGVTFGIPNPLADFVPDMETPDVLNEKLDGFESTSISVEVTKRHSQAKSKNSHEQVAKKSTELLMTVDGGILKSAVNVAAKWIHGEFESDADAAAVSFAVENSTEIVTQSNHLASAVIGQTVHLGVSAMSPAANCALAFSLLKAANRSEIESPSIRAQLQTLFKSAAPGDGIRCQYNLSKSAKWQIVEMMDAASAQYNPKKAKAMLADMSHYQLSRIELIRDRAESSVVQTSVASAITQTKTTSVSRLSVVAEIDLSDSRAAGGV